MRIEQSRRRCPYANSRLFDKFRRAVFLGREIVQVVESSPFEEAPQEEVVLDRFAVVPDVGRGFVGRLDRISKPASGILVLILTLQESGDRPIELSRHGV